MEDYKSALDSHQHALQIRLKLLGEDHADTAESYYRIGVTQMWMEDYKSALDSHQHALQIRLKLLGEDHADTAKSYHEIGVTQNNMEDYKSALDSHQHALQIRLKCWEKIMRTLHKVITALDSRNMK
jgi:tetratricopeptide (TPR) repeat protein